MTRKDSGALYGEFKQTGISLRSCGLRLLDNPITQWIGFHAVAAALTRSDTSMGCSEVTWAIASRVAWNDPPVTSAPETLSTGFAGSVPSRVSRIQPPSTV